MEDKNMTLEAAEQRIIELEGEVRELKAELKRVSDLYLKVKERRFNERGAGRKKNDAKWQARFNEFVRLYKMNLPEADIESQMKISRSTYYRFKKCFVEKK